LGATSWEYVAYRNGASELNVVTSTGVTSAAGYIAIEEKGGKAILRMVVGPYADVCYKGDLNATVARTEATTIITAANALRGCDPFRFVIKNDGSGGQKQLKNGSDWVSDGLDHGLTPRK
jgi:hypothetical protein